MAACVVLAGLAASGCVTRGTYTEVVDERDRLSGENARLAARVQALETSTRSLTQELDRTLEQYEDLSIDHDSLLEESERLRQSEKGLESALSERSVELVRSQTELETARRELERLTSTYTTLMADLESEVSSGQIQIEQLREGIRVNVSDDVLFASGSANLDPLGRQVLDKVAAQLVAMDHEIEVQGHTDDRQIRGGLKERFPTNWELAAARASRVVRLLQDAGIPGERLSVVSFAAFRPIAPNESAESRALNRRIEIRLKPVGGPVSAARGAAAFRPATAAAAPESDSAATP